MTANIAFSEGLVKFTYEADASIGIYTGPPSLAGSADPNYGKQFTFVKITGPRTVGLAVGAVNEQALGVLQNKPQKVGTGATVATRGISLVQVGTGGLANNDLVKADASGKAIKATRGTDAESLIVGQCVIAAAAGSVASVHLKTGF